MKNPIHKRIKWWLIDTKNALKRAYNRFKYKVNGGYACSCCGALLPVYYDSIESKSNGISIMISNSSNGKLFCPKCLSEKIETYFKMAPGIDSAGHMISTSCMCNWNPKEAEITIPWIMEHESDLAKSLGLDIRFGGNWWNGHHACLLTFREALTNPDLKYKTHVICIDPKDGEFKYRDRNGVCHGSVL